MRPGKLPARGEMVVLFAHAAYQLGAELERRNTGIKYLEARSLDEFRRQIGRAHVASCSMMWRNDLLDVAPTLVLVQSVSAGMNQYDVAAFKAAGIRLASAQGVNARAVAEHAIALILSITRQLHTARDNQRKKVWRGMIGDPARREDELQHKTLLIVGLGGIGGRLAQIAKAFGMNVLAMRQDPTKGPGDADAVFADRDLLAVLPQADIVVLTCPITPATTNLINGAAFAAMKPGTILINVARGPVVDELALIDALQSGRLAAAGIDVTVEEPLAPTSALWTMENVVLTPHTAGETRAYEANVVDILLENIGRLERGETRLRNEFA
jgi:D-2-hydroxyacid dehydrogenase (NADP+)